MFSVNPIRSWVLFAIISGTLAEQGCNVFCSTSPPDGSCCDRFHLIENRDSDIVITASTTYNHRIAVDRAALFTPEDPSGAGHSGWAALTLDQNQWIQVDFGSPRRVTGVLLQGRNGCSCNQWVTSFRVLFSNDGETFYSTPTMEGTFDRDTVARRYLDKPIVARYFRLNPITWNVHITLRFDLLGCKV